MESKNDEAEKQRLALRNFLPYRLSVLANVISGHVARIYADRFAITIPEWRVMAVLGLGKSFCANDVCGMTAMDKVQVSRAITRLINAGLVARAPDDHDRRRANLDLTAKGDQVYRDIVPEALTVEAHLLSALSPDEVRSLDLLLQKLQARAEELAANP